MGFQTFSVLHTHLQDLFLTSLEDVQVILIYLLFKVYGLLSLMSQTFLYYVVLSWCKYVSVIM